MNKSQKYRLKNLEAYRSRKAAYARTPEQRATRREYMRRWREENRERHNELARQSHQRNRHKHVAKNRERHLASAFGLTSEQYDRMSADQGGKCFICEQPEKAGRRLAVDHCHVTGKVRRLLCFKCNSRLGWVESHRGRIQTYIDTKW